MNYFLLSFIPAEWITFAIHSIFISGIIGLIVGSFASKISIISVYGNIIKAVAGILFVIGLFAEGYNLASQEWIEEAKKFEEKVKIAEEKSKEVNTQIKTVYVDRVKVVKEQQVVIQEKIKEVEKIIDANCEVAPEVIDILNQAAKPPVKQENK